jgi:hypothetical protein
MNAKCLGDDSVYFLATPPYFRSTVRYPQASHLQCLKDMPSPKLPNPSEFEELHFVSPVLEKFPKQLPIRTGEKKSYPGIVVRNNKFRTAVCVMAFLAMVGGTVAAALFISKGMQRINEGQAAISAHSSSPTVLTTTTPLQSTVMQTMMVTQTSVVTGQITIPVSQLQSTIYAIVTAPPAPSCHLSGWRCRGDVR